MAIVSRTQDASVQKQVLSFSNFSLALSTGETGVLSYVPYPCQLVAANLAAFSVTSDPTVQFTVSRFVVGQGFTSYVLGSAFQPPSYGTSGVLGAGVSLLASGSSLLYLMPGDVLGYEVGGGSTAGIFGMCGAFIVKPTQDIRTYLGTLA